MATSASVKTSSVRRHRHDEGREVARLQLEGGIAVNQADLHRTLGSQHAQRIADIARVGGDRHGWGVVLRGQRERDAAFPDVRSRSGGGKLVCPEDQINPAGLLRGDDLDLPKQLSERRDQ